MTQEQFIESSLKWNNLLCPANTLELQTQIVEQEQNEFSKAQKAKDQKEMELEAADCLWTIAYLIAIAEKEGKKLYAKALRALMDFYGKFTSEKALRAVSKSNWLKCWDSPWGKMGATYHHLDQNRFRDLDMKEVERDGRVWQWLIGDDYRDPDNPIKGKILKPANWESASSIYDRI